MNKTQINKLLVKVSHGDNQAFEKLYLETRKSVFSFIYTYFYNYHDTEDVMQDVYLKIKKNISQYQAGTNGLAWILQIAKNHSLNNLKKRYKNKTYNIDDVMLKTEDSHDFGTVTRIMEKILTEEEQRIITLHVLSGYKHREISELLNISTGTITSKYKRAIEKLKKKIKEGNNEID